MARCGNCSAKLGCSCKIRKATDNKSCCVTCVTGYNAKLKQNKKRSIHTNTQPSVIISATAKQIE
tara:strand:+ start:901 stop:1095 length:195 start_codon:yes stop_codon:yes gene_type:complete